MPRARASCPSSVSGRSPASGTALAQLGVEPLQLAGPGEQVGLHPLGPVLAADGLLPGLLAAADVAGDVVGSGAAAGRRGLVVDDRHVARAPEALDPGAVRERDVVLLDRHGDRPAGVAGVGQRVAEVADAVGPGVVGVHREDVEQVPAHRLRQGGGGGLQPGPVGAHDDQVRGQQQERNQRLVEDAREVRRRQVLGRPAPHLPVVVPTLLPRGHRAGPLPDGS